MEKICSESDVPKGTMKGFEVKGRKILIANVDGTFYAMDAVCSHMQGYLPKGKLVNSIVICPVHQANYDVTTGKVVKNVSGVIKLFTRKEATGQQVFKTSVKEGAVFADI